MGKESKHKKEKKEKKSHKKTKHKSSKESIDSKKDKETKSSSRGTSSIVPITEDDYFVKSEEFRVWCRLEKHKSFESLTSDETHHLFTKEFMKEYNRGKLSKMYYEGIPQEIRETALKSKHNWHLRLSETEQDQVSSVASRVDRLTRKDFDPSLPLALHVHALHSDDPGLIQGQGRGPVQGLGERSGAMRGRGKEEEVLYREEEKDRRKWEERKGRERTREVLEDIAPRDTGRVEKASFQPSRQRDREGEKEGRVFEEREELILGGGDDFASEVRRRERAKERTHHQREERIRDLQSREKERENEWKEKLGIQGILGGGGKVLIQPRPSENN